MHQSFVVEKGQTRTVVEGNLTTVYYKQSYWPGDSIFDHLEFALKYEGCHLPYLRAILLQVSSIEVTRYVRGKPTSSYARKIWFLFEHLHQKKLDLRDVGMGNYIDLLDPVHYYTGQRENSSRHRVVMNLPGNLDFSPMIARTKVLAQWEQRRLDEQARKIMAEVSAEVLERAIRYLYGRETKSSFEIEREPLDRVRQRTFMDLLHEAPRRDFLSKAALVELQQRIVDSRFSNNGYRDSTNDQNYVGTTLSPGNEEVHFIPPKPQDIGDLMEHFLTAARRILASEIHPIVAAAAIAYPFVFLHPFSDGNGRAHRFLIHYVLSYLRFGPDGAIFPVSAAMLQDSRKYDLSLECFSEPSLELIDYTLDSQGRLFVKNETKDVYRYIDCTKMAEALFGFVETTIRKELPAEITFLRQYDRARTLMRSVVDLPNRHADLFIRLALQGGGKLSKKKRRLSEFAALTEQEIAQLEAAFAKAFAK